MQFFRQQWSRLRAWARNLKREVVAIWFAARDPATPWYARWLAMCVAAYALSPIDLIPDFIPVLGYLDDVILVPAGIWLVLRWIPEPVMTAARAKADAALERPVSRRAAATVVVAWLLGAALVTWWLVQQS